MRCPYFRRSICQRRHLKTLRLFKIRPIRCLKTSGTGYPVAQRNIPEGRILQVKRCGYLKTAFKTLQGNTHSVRQGDRIIKLGDMRHFQISFLNLVPRLRISGVIHPLPHTPLRRVYGQICLSVIFSKTIFFNEIRTSGKVSNPKLCNYIKTQYNRQKSKQPFLQ
jgi:hypothetical protein